MILMNQTLDKYLRLLRIAQKYTGLDNLDLILKYCEFFPIINKDKSILPKEWIDMNNTSIFLEKNTVLVKPNQLGKQILPTDLYSYISLNNCLKITNRILIIESNCIDDKIHIIICRCVDNKIRAYYCGDKITRICPLNIGYELINKLFSDSLYMNSINIDNFDLSDNSNYICCDYPGIINSPLLDVVKKFI